MKPEKPQFSTRLASSDSDLRAAQRVRYEVFVNELGSDGPEVDHEQRLERDRFDPYFDHLLLIDENAGSEIPEGVVGVYRLLRDDQADQVGQFYSEDEYDLTKLRQTGRRLLELGRSCLLPAYRGSVAMYHMWNGLADYVLKHEIEILFGVASFHGTDPDNIAGSLSLLHSRHLAPEDLRVTAREPNAIKMDRLPADEVDARAAMLAVPALIKAYLKLGGFVGDGAYLDREFNTIDVCLLMDTERMNKNQRALYEKARPV